MTITPLSAAEAGLEQPVALIAKPPPAHNPVDGPELLPLDAGEQYRFRFELESCVGCHSCEVACAEQNDLPTDVAWRKVGELEGGAFPDTQRFSMSMACNHCLDPTCLSGCPTEAYTKLANGIVQHHPDECIGCQYCIWNCPYEVPVFDRARKIVSKCDMCLPRLDAGQKPACVMACPTKAITVEPVNVAAWLAEHAEADAPGLPPSAITISTTKVVLPADLPDDIAAVSEAQVAPEDPHWPLIALTLLTQIALGTVAATVATQIFAGPAGTGLAGASMAGDGTGGAGMAGYGTGGAGMAGDGTGGASMVAFLAGAVALCASLLHLGRPTRALKAMRNLRRSWLSREVLLFTAFAAVSFVYAIASAAGSGGGASAAVSGGALAAGSGIGRGASAVVSGGASGAQAWTALGFTAGLVAVVVGVAGVYASGRIYLVPARPVWNSARTLVAFFATALATGPLVALLRLDRAALGAAWVDVLLAVAGAATLVQVGVHAHLLRTTMTRSDHQHRGTAELLLKRFPVLLLARVGAAVAALLLLASVPGAPDAAAASGRLATALVVVALGELAGRYLFYVTVVPHRAAGAFRAASKSGGSR